VAVPGRRHRRPLAGAHHLVEHGQGGGADARDDLLPLVARRCQLLFEPDGILLHPAALALDLRLRLPQIPLAPFHLRGHVVGLDHRLEDFVLDALHVVLATLDLLLHGLVLAVGLHLHQLILELGQPRLGRAKVLVERPACRLEDGGAVARRGDLAAGAGQAVVQRLDAIRVLGERAAGGGDGVFEALEADESFEVREHRVHPG
jgi:hypothetical protein